MRSTRGARVGAVGSLAAVLSLFMLAGHPAAAAAPVNLPFNPPAALPGGTGATGPSLVVAPGGPVGVFASNAPGEGCSLFTVSHTGGDAQYLGRLPGGTGCAITAGMLQGGSLLSYSATQPAGAVAGHSTTGGASFTWAGASVSPMGPMAADPAPNSAGTTDLYALVADAGGVPHIAVSSDGGATFQQGSSIIDPAQVPEGQWRGSAFAPVVGNLVARRDDVGVSLYTIFETFNDAADQKLQAKAGTHNLNRVYAAVGRVAPGIAGAAPTIIWRDQLVWAAPWGTALNRALPATAVDAAGHVYAVFSDGRHINVKQDFDGLHWAAATKPVTVDTVASGLPAGLDAALLPSIATGGNGDADIVWYAATGGDTSRPDPASDPQNTWNVYMAQTLDGGKTWSADPVTKDGVHQGALCVASDTACTATQGAITYPDSALQVALDQLTGAAVAAFSGDEQLPGTLSLFETRQCTGLSAVSGNTLVDDCVALQPATPVLPGTSCPGPQITDSPGDAIRTLAPGGGTNLTSLDLLDVRIAPVDQTSDLATITVNVMSNTLPRGVDAATWRVMWTEGADRRFVQAVMTRGAGVEYSVGTLNSDGSVAGSQPAVGSITAGPGGGITINVNHSAIGNPANGTRFTNLEAASYAQYAGVPSALGRLLVDRAPDGGFGAPYAVGGICPPATDLPDVPMAAALPVVGGITGILVTCVRRRRARRVSASTPEEI